MAKNKTNFSATSGRVRMPGTVETLMQCDTPGENSPTRASRNEITDFITKVEQIIPTCGAAHGLDGETPKKLKDLTRQISMGEYCGLLRSATSYASRIIEKSPEQDKIAWSAAYILKSTQR